MQGELRWADFMRCWAWEPYKLAMKLRRAIITAAGRDDQPLPLQRLIDRDGGSKTALQIVVEEAVAAGASEIAIVVRPGQEQAFRSAAGSAA